uniref:Uncharacterized protein n=1 Tax=Plectus sambesii TaxID=2011161 RepID=A0A914V8H4_9BILA
MNNLSSALFSPPMSRRTAPLSVAANRSFPNTPAPSYPSTSAQYHYQQAYQPSAYSSGDGYGGPSSLPSQNFLMQQQRAQSLGPAADDLLYSTGGGGGGGYGATTTRFADSPMSTRRSQSFGLSRPALTRQHRSFDGADLFAADSLFRPVGASVDFPVVSSTQQQQGGYSSSGGSRPFYPMTSTAQQPLSIATGGQHQHQQQLHSSGPLSNPNASAALWSTAPAGQLPPIAPMNVAQFSRDPYSMPVPVLQREYEMLRREYEQAVQKLNSTMNSIKTFWSPELKRERMSRKEEAAKLSLLQEQLRMGGHESQKQSSVIRQLQTELQCQYDLQRTIRDVDIQSVSREEYDALRMERDRIHREMQLAKDNLRELESQTETHRQTLNARDESLRKMLDMLQGKGQIPYNAIQERMELERLSTRTIELENRCRHLESLASMKDNEIRRLQEDWTSSSDRARQIQQQLDYIHSMPSDQRERDDSAYLAMMQSKDARIEDLEKQLEFYDQEVNRLRQDKMNQPTDYTDKMVTNHEFQTMKLKMEKSELELSHRAAELQTSQTRLQTAEEQISDLRKHLQVVKEANNAKEQQLSLLQGDIEALRTKLETKNESIEQKQSTLVQAQNEASRMNNQLADMKEQLKIRDNKLTMLQRKVEGLEELTREKERLIESLKQRMQNMPAVQQQRQLQDQLEESMRDKERLSREIREQRDSLESERLEQLEAHRREVRDLRMAIESLQKEIADRQVLIESQSENIADLNRELSSLRIVNNGLLAKDADGPEIDRLAADLHQARGEVDRLLKMVQNFERERETLGTRMKDLQRQLDETKQRQFNMPSVAMRTGDSLTRKGGAADQQARIEELEEALRESVSITAEREMAIAQHRQLNQQLQMQINDYKSQMSDLRRSTDAVNASSLEQNRVDKDQLIRSLKNERKKHLEEVLQLKHEAIVAAIGEKDAHIALLEMSRERPRTDEIETLKRHKDKLIKKLKDENERRMQLHNENLLSEDGELTGSLAKDHKASPVDQPCKCSRLRVSSGRRSDAARRRSDASRRGCLVVFRSSPRLFPTSSPFSLIQSVRCVELQKKKLRLFIDQLVASILELDPDLLTGLPRTQQSQGIEIKYLDKLSHEQLLLELQQRENDSLQLQHYANQLLQRLFHVQPGMVRRAMRLLDSFGVHNDAPMQPICLREATEGPETPPGGIHPPRKMQPPILAKSVMPRPSLKLARGGEISA